MVKYFKQWHMNTFYKNMLVSEDYINYLYGCHNLIVQPRSWHLEFEVIFSRIEVSIPIMQYDPSAEEKTYGNIKLPVESQ